MPEAIPPIPKPAGLRIDLRGATVDRLGNGAKALIPGAAVMIVLAALSLAKEQPKAAFDLLDRWGGAWWLVALVGMYLLWDVIRLGVKYVGALAEGMSTLSVAVTRIADKDDREQQELRIITQYTGQKTDRILDELVEQRQTINTILEQVKAR